MRVADPLVACDAPAFMTNQSATMFTGSVGVISVAVKDRGIDEHGNLQKKSARVFRPLLNQAHRFS
jgi:hypothetical protein